MENQERPNLFSYATSELSQDAFICWLAAWADPKYKDVDAGLHQAGQNFIMSMIMKIKTNYDTAKIKTVEVTRQAERLDILIEVNKESLDGKLAVLVEDKTHTDHHSGQLKRYYESVEVNYTRDQMIPIYFKTGYQSRFDNLREFKTYLRSDFLVVLRSGIANEVKNAIFCDFIQHMETMDMAIRQFSSRELEDWKDNDWRGFFMNLYDTRHELYKPIIDDGANWSYVANPSGGFYGFWWYFKNLPDKAYVPYLQLEQEKLCFKIMVEEPDRRQNSRDEANYRIMQTASQLGLQVLRPNRMGNGKFMTVARWSGDYREFNNGKLDMTATLENLKKAQTLLDTAFSVT